MTFSKKLNYHRKKIRRPDGSFFKLVEVKTSPTSILEFQRTNSDNHKEKLVDIGHARLLKAYERGIADPVVIVWAGYNHGQLIKDYFPDLLPVGNDSYISLNAWIKTTLQYLIKSKNYLISNKELFVKKINNEKDRQANLILDVLKKEERLAVFMAEQKVNMKRIYQNFDYQCDLVGVGQLAFPSKYCRKNQYSLGFNSSFFLLEDADWESKYSLLGDPYGLQITLGEIVRPPIYRRSALLLDKDGNWEVRQPFLDELILTYKSQTWDLGQFAVNSPAEKSIYTRYYGIKEKGLSLNITPLTENKVELIIIDNNIVGVREGGGSQIPQNGFVLSLPADEFAFDSLTPKVKVGYRFKGNNSYWTAIQAGPLLVKDYKLVLNRNSLKNEQFFGKSFKKKRPQFRRVVPTDYAPDIDQTRAARMVAGITSDNQFCLLTVESVNSGMELKGESTGATLLEMAELARDKKYKYAINLDGGGSTNIQYHYGNLLITADRRGLPGVIYERMVPAMGVVTNN